jgi:hypothetical protein
MADFKPQDPEQHFALQRANRAAETVKVVFEAQQKAGEEIRSANERFYNSLALFSSGTVALSVTFLGYLKNLPKPIAHPHWLVACWICLIVCLGASLFWLFTYGHYTHYFHEWQMANAQKEQFETEAKEYPTLARGSISMKTKQMTSQQEIDGFQSNRREAAAIMEKKAAGAKRLENHYRRCWRALGWFAQSSFVAGLVMLLLFASKNI